MTRDCRGFRMCSVWTSRCRTTASKEMTLATSALLATTMRFQTRMAGFGKFCVVSTGKELLRLVSQDLAQPQAVRSLKVGCKRGP
ncbi:hypothetical protein Mapa_009550 [Marchantia paleacea]|nr:hypothetical protein Mapa_009550 [Marchantia paleacea]